MQQKTLASITLSIALAVLLFNVPALAGGYNDYARVISVKPVYYSETVVKPYYDCDGPAHYRDKRKRHSHSQAIIGGVAGGLLAHEIDDSKGSVIAGTIIGSQLGNRHNKPNHYGKERCRSVKPYRIHRQVKGYQVRYRYKGKTYHTQTRYHPGKRIKIRVDITPVSH